MRDKKESTQISEFLMKLGKPQKKSSSTNGLSPFKNTNYFTLNNLSKYGNITLKFLSVGIFTCLSQYFPKNRAILVQKLWGEKKLSKSVFGYFKKKKKFRWPLSSSGGVRP